MAFTARMPDYIAKENPKVTFLCTRIDVSVAARNKVEDNLSSWLTKRKWLYFASDERRKDGGDEIYNKQHSRPDQDSF